MPAKRTNIADLRDILALLQGGQWNAAHDHVQRHEGVLAAWLHGLLHLQEGDIEDAENWYERAGRHFRQRGTLQHELAQFKATLEAGTANINCRSTRALLEFRPNIDHYRATGIV
ncbi:hypothetical protein [Burkholderia cenocepacia]|uniref:hypothetical protein n=1 Tax=Burkholderia cenocepacia TaxID=95486 RepID=UPI00201395F2|nr:hypothetical protein [Burkholderia cenocepacia]